MFKKINLKIFNNTIKYFLLISILIFFSFIILLHFYSKIIEGYDNNTTNILQQYDKSNINVTRICSNNNNNKDFYGEISFSDGAIINLKEGSKGYTIPNDSYTINKCDDISLKQNDELYIYTISNENSSVTGYLFGKNDKTKIRIENFINNREALFTYSINNFIEIMKNLYNGFNIDFDGYIRKKNFTDYNTLEVAKNNTTTRINSYINESNNYIDKIKRLQQLETKVTIGNDYNIITEKNNNLLTELTRIYNEKHKIIEDAIAKKAADEEAERQRLTKKAADEEAERERIQNLETKIITYTGKDFIVDIPQGYDIAKIQCWGAGGATTGYGSLQMYNSGAGGGGGYTSSIINISGYNNMKVIVGEGGKTNNYGQPSSATYGGGGGQPIYQRFGYDSHWGSASGGGRSAVQLNTGSTYVEIITAGGGGAGGGSVNNTPNVGTGGGGGGGNAHNSDKEGGSGGTQSAGGARTRLDEERGDATSGSKFTGGTGSVYGGGGGGGYYGGGGGGIYYNDGMFKGHQFGGGGGGSSYINTTYQASNAENINTQGTAPNVANNSALPDNYKNKIGNGGKATSSIRGGSNGQNGLVIINFKKSNTSNTFMANRATLTPQNIKLSNYSTDKYGRKYDTDTCELNDTKGTNFKWRGGLPRDQGKWYDNKGWGYRNDSYQEKYSKECVFRKTQNPDDPKEYGW